MAGVAAAVAGDAGTHYPDPAAAAVARHPQQYCAADFGTDYDTHFDTHSYRDCNTEALAEDLPAAPSSSAYSSLY